MIRESKRKQLHYRKATFSTIHGKSLQELVEEALRKLAAVADRMQGLDDGTSDGWKRFINTHRSYYGMEFGNMVLYAPDQSRNIIAIDEAADELDIEQIAPFTGADGKKRQFLESLLYYGLYGNHVVLLQSMSLKARDIEHYFNWLLRKAGVLSEDNHVFLNNYAPTATQEKLERAEVKSVRIGTPLFNTEAAAESVDESADSSAEAKKVRFRPSEGMDVLKAFVSPDRLGDVSWAELEGASNLDVFVEVTYKRQTDERSQKVLNRITSALRHVSDEDIRIELKNGGTIVGSDLQIKNFMNVDSYGGVVDPSDLFNKMNSWLVQILEQGLIDAD